MKEKKLKFNDESELLVRKIIDKQITSDGRTVVRTQWFKVEGEMNFGSLADKNNKDVVEWKYNIPDKNKPNILGNLFR